MRRAKGVLVKRPIGAETTNLDERPKLDEQNGNLSDRFWVKLLVRGKKCS